MHNHNALADLRVKNRLTKDEMADILKVSFSTYNLQEDGALPLNLEELNVLSNTFDVSFDYLLGLSKKRARDHFCKNVDYRYLRFCVRYLRKKSRITQKELAKHFNISLYSISNYEHDGTKININYVILISKMFHISSDYLCGKSLKKEVL